MSELKIPNKIKRKLVAVKVLYKNFDGEDKIGNIICNDKVKHDIIDIFNELYSIKFPIYQVKPIYNFDNDDIKSVKANNTSCFNYRYILGTKILSDHSYGVAIDINPLQNPWMDKNAVKDRVYDINNKGTINQDVVNIFKKYGWKWGGDWKVQDYQHFYKEKKVKKVKKIINKILNKSGLL